MLIKRIVASGNENVLPARVFSRQSNTTSAWEKLKEAQINRHCRLVNGRLISIVNSDNPFPRRTSPLNQRPRQASFQVRPKCQSPLALFYLRDQNKSGHAQPLARYVQPTRRISSPEPSPLSRWQTAFLTW